MQSVSLWRDSKLIPRIGSANQTPTRKAGKTQNDDSKKANRGADRDRSQPTSPAGMARPRRRDSGSVGYAEADLMQTRWQLGRQRLAIPLKTRARQLFKQYRIILRALVHPAVPWYAKLVCGCAALYIASPIQLIPNFIPVIGQLDDVLVIALSIRLLKRSVPPSVLDECQNGSRLPIGSAIPLSLPIDPSPALRPEVSPPGFCQ